MNREPAAIGEPAPGGRRLAAMPAAIAARILLLVAAFAIVGCSAGSLVSRPATGPVLTVSLRGGHCIDGPCDRSVVLEADGSVHTGEKPPNELGRVTNQAMAALAAAMQQADFAAMAAKPFAGECPVAFDGQELIFEFMVGGTVRRLASCEVDIDWGHPLFVAVGVALGEWLPLPLT